MNKHLLVEMWIVLLGLIFICGCPISIQTGIDTYDIDQSRGFMSKDYPKSMQDTWTALLTVAKSKEFKLEITNQQFGAQKSSLDAIQPAILFVYARQNVRIELVAKSDKVTTVKAKYGDPSKENPLLKVLFGSEAEAWEKDFHGNLMDTLGIPRSTEFEVPPMVVPSFKL